MPRSAGVPVTSTWYGLHRTPFRLRTGLISQPHGPSPWEGFIPGPSPAGTMQCSRSNVIAKIRFMQAGKNKVKMNISCRSVLKFHLQMDKRPFLNFLGAQRSAVTFLLLSLNVFLLIVFQRHLGLVTSAIAFLFGMDGAPASCVCNYNSLYQLPREVQLQNQQGQLFQKQLFYLLGL